VSPHNTAHEAGVGYALEKLGLFSHEDKGHPLRKVLTTAGAVAPFLGYVGKQRLINDPNYGAKPLVGRQSVHELMQEAQPGDVVVYRNGLPLDKLSPYATGSHWSHIEPVVGKHEGLYGTTALIGEPGTKTIGERFADPRFKSQELALLRPKLFLNNAGHITPEMRDFIETAQTESPKSWELARSIRSGLSDIFMPKIPGFTERRHARVQGGRYCGQNCATSTGEAMTAATGQAAPVVRGKGPRDLLPADFMRSKDFQLISHTFNPEIEHLTGAEALTRGLGARAGIAALLAGGAYTMGADPTVAAGMLGGLVPSAVRTLGRLEPGTLPKFKHFTRAIMNPQGTEEALRVPAALIKRRFLTRTLPLGIGAGALAWLATRKAKQKIQDAVS